MPANRFTPLWLLVSMLIFGFPTMAQTNSGCDLAFLPSTNTPTINGIIGQNEWDDATLQTSGSGACLYPLPEGTSLSTISTSLPDHEIKIYTKRDATNLYFAFDVPDATTPPLNQIGDQIIILLDPNQSRDTAIKTGDFRLEIIVFGSPGSSQIKWFDVFMGAWRSVDTMAGAIGGATLLNNVKVGMQNRPSGSLGYVVEVGIPFNAIGYTLGGTPDSITDIGIAAAVINDLGFQAEIVMGEGSTEILSGAGFPDTPTLHLTDASNVLINPNTLITAAWDNPSNWGSGFLTGAGDAVYFSPAPRWWKSRDIKVGFCNAANFAEIQEDPFTNDPKRYKYKTSNPCNPRIWARIRRSGGVGPIRRRVLFLWAESGANPQKWHFVHLTDPVTVPQGMATVTTPGKDWTDVPPNVTEHPCLRAFILPENLIPGFDSNFFQCIGKEGTGNCPALPPGAGGNNESKTTLLKNAYGLKEKQIVQMNIDLIVPFSCPTCVPCTDCAASIGSSSNPILASYVPPLAFAALPTAAAQKDQATDTTSGKDRDRDMRDVVIDFEVFGAIVSPGPKKYSFFEPMGGLAKIINLGHLRGEREVRVAFNISNSSDYPRRLFVSSILRAPADVRDVRVKFDHPDITLNPGETRRMTASISATSRGHSELERFSVSLRAGASVPHGTFKQFSDVGANFGVGFEARANGAVSAEVIFGYHRFLSANLGPDLGLFQFSGNLKVYTPDAAVRFFASAGPGVYKFDPGDADIGGNFGSGIQYNVTSRFAVEGAYNLHVVNTPGSSAKFSTVQAGLRYRF